MGTLLLRGTDKSVDRLIDVLRCSKEQNVRVQSSTSEQRRPSCGAGGSTASTLLMALKNWENNGSYYVTSNAKLR